MEQKIKQGDFVRLTDPLSNGQIVRIESVDEHGFASWLGGSQYCDMEQIPCKFEAYPIGENSLANYYETLSDVISDLESKIGVKVYPESAVEYWKNRAESEEKEHAYYEKAWNKEHNKLLDAQDEIDKLKEYIKKVCAESSADIQRLDTENKELRERNAALKRQLDESNKQIEIYAQKVNNLEADLEEGGFNDERNFI